MNGLDRLIFGGREGGRGKSFVVILGIVVAGVGIVF